MSDPQATAICMRLVCVLIALTADGHEPTRLERKCARTLQPDDIFELSETVRPAERALVFYEYRPDRPAPAGPHEQAAELRDIAMAIIAYGGATTRADCDPTVDELLKTMGWKA